MTRFLSRGPALHVLVPVTLIITHQVAGKATRDALFLSYFSVTQLPKVVIVATLLSMLSVVFAFRLLARSGPSQSRCTPMSCIAGAWSWSPDSWTRCEGRFNPMPPERH